MGSEAFPHENNGGNIVPALKFTGCIEKHAIRVVGSVAGARFANSLPSISVLSFLHANQIEKPKSWRDKKSELPIFSLRTRGQSRINQRKRNPARVRFGGEIGPNLRLNQNDPRWANDRKRLSHYWPVIKRRVHDLDPRRSVLVREGESGCGGSG